MFYSALEFWNMWYLVLVFFQVGITITKLWKSATVLRCSERLIHLPNSQLLFYQLSDFLGGGKKSEIFVMIIKVALFYQEGTQIPFVILPLYRPEEKSRGSDRGRILQTPEGETQIHSCTFFFTARRNAWFQATVLGPIQNFVSFHSQNKTGNEAIAKFEEAASLRRAAIIKTAMGEEWSRMKRGSCPHWGFSVFSFCVVVFMFLALGVVCTMCWFVVPALVSLILFMSFLCCHEIN